MDISVPLARITMQKTEKIEEAARSKRKLLLHTKPIIKTALEQTKPWSKKVMKIVKCCHTMSDVANMCVVPVRLKYGSLPVVETYSMLANFSDGTFIDRGLLKELKVSGTNTNITVKTVNGERSKE